MPELKWELTSLSRRLGLVPQWKEKRSRLIRDWWYGPLCVCRASGHRPSGSGGYYVRYCLNLGDTGSGASLATLRFFVFKTPKGRIRYFRTFQEARSFAERQLP